MNLLALKVFTDLKLLEYLRLIFPCEISKSQYHQIKQNVRFKTLVSGMWL